MITQREIGLIQKKMGIMFSHYSFDRPVTVSEKGLMNDIIILIESIEELKSCLELYRGIAGRDCDNSPTKYSAADELLNRMDGK